MMESVAGGQDVGRPIGKPILAQSWTLLYYIPPHDLGAGEK